MVSEEKEQPEKVAPSILNKENKPVNESSNSHEIKHKIKFWLSDKYNLIFLGIILFALGLRLYYFFITLNQPIWWDESEYMAQAKAIAGLVHYDASAIRSPVFPAFMSIFFFLGIANETVMRFFGLFIPSLIVIALTYFMVKEMYSDKRIALISTLIIAVLWEHLFYSNRFQTENIALIFQFLAIFIFFKCSIKGQNFYFIKAKYALVWILLFAVISFLFRPGNVMFVPALFLLFLLLSKDKILTKTGLISLGVFIFGVIAAFFVSNKPLEIVSPYFHLSDPLGWKSLGVFYGFYQSSVPILPSLLFYAFLIGLVMVIFRSALVLDLIKTFKVNSDNLEFKSDLFSIILLLVVLFVFVFIMRANDFEYRWFFPLLPAMLIFTAKGVTISSDYIAKLVGKKSLAIILIVLISILGAYTQVYHADQIIKLKVDSYSQVRDAALWLKESYPKNTKVLSISYPQTVYYSELNVSTYSWVSNESAFNEYLSQTRPEILEVSAFEPHPKWLNNWLTENQNETVPVKVYFADAKQTQPVLVLYDLKIATDPNKIGS